MHKYQPISEHILLLIQAAKIVIVTMIQLLFYFTPTQSVVIDGINSKPSSVLSGVPQGMVLAPQLFLIFINDIVKHQHCTVKLYADNILMHAMYHWFS